uniref:Uncharacterized protein LOC114335304 n=1 Tax=Diabrotica virgifera virgifera TaxID=50390 RepID=A0A6P7FXX9_DIAVI
MASKGLLRNLNNYSKFCNFSSINRALSSGKIIYNKSQSSGGSIPNVPGLSDNCVKVPSSPVGPGAAKNTGYKNPEYFCYDKNSYFEAEVEMLEHRCPQPSVHVPYYPTSK